MLHYIQDHYLDEQQDGTGYAYTFMKHVFVLYHWLRVLGWEWLWSCSHYGTGTQDRPMYIADGDMEALDLGSWNVVGTATLAKDTTNKHMGLRSLKVTSNASGDGVAHVSVQLTSGYANHYYALWAANDSGAAWNVDGDFGAGYTTLGTIPDNGGVWTRYVFGPYSATTAAGKIKVYDNNATQGFIHLDSMFVFIDYFEFSYEAEGSDGDVQNGNEFHSAGYTFQAGDIGKTVVFFDPNNLGNSGAYTIGSISVSNAVLNLRVGGAETLVNTTVGNLQWRLIDPINKGPYTPTAGQIPPVSAGFGLESPHSSKWRMFWRGRCQDGAQPGKTYVVWSGTDDFDFSVMTGEPLSGCTPFTHFMKSYKWDQSQLHYGTGQVSPVSGGDRLYAMAAGDGAFVAWVDRGGTTYPGGVIGYLSTDTDYAAEERFFQFCRRRDVTGNTYGDEAILSTAYGLSYAGSAGTQEGVMVTATILMPSTVDNTMMSNTYNQANPYSGREWIAPATLARGHMSDYNYGEMALDVEGGAIVIGNNGLTLWNTFDNHNYMYFRGCLGWKWMGRSVIS